MRWNGWQRLRAALALLWTVLVGVFVWAAWPHPQQPPPAPDPWAQYPVVSPAPASPPQADPFAAYRVTAAPAQPAQDDRTNYLAALHASRVQTLLVGAVVWLIPMGLYGLGLWVYRGFTSDRSKTPLPPSVSL